LKKVIFFLLVLVFSQECRAEEYRIISLAPNTTEILFKLGLGDSIVGVDRYSDYPEAARKVEKVGTFVSPNLEKIILLKPDYILLHTDVNKDMRDYLEGLGINIIKISPNSLEEICDSINMLGVIFNMEGPASFIVEDIRERIKAVSQKIEGDRPKVFVQLSSDPLITVSSFIGDIIRLAGGDNIARDIKGNAALFSYEVLIQRNPDIVLVIGFSEDSNLPDSISAVKNNRIYKDLDPNVLLRPGPRAIEAIEELNRIFYEKD